MFAPYPARTAMRLGMAMLAAMSLCCLACSCGFRPAHAPAAAAPTAPAPGTETGSPASRQPAPVPAKPGVSHWVFKVDEAQSKGLINLSLDPKGPLLGAKPASGTSALRGEIHADVTTFPDGTRRLKITRVSLTNTRLLDMPFRWSRLVGRIGVSIPRHVLGIRHHTIPAHSVGMDGEDFSIRSCHFSVGGTARVSGTGLVLGKAVGNRAVDLTIRKTEPVVLRGSVDIAGNTATLKIPAAVMRDQFDLEGSLLKLQFTGQVTARAVVR